MIYLIVDSLIKEKEDDLKGGTLTLGQTITTVKH